MAAAPDDSPLLGFQRTMFVSNKYIRLVILNLSGCNEQKIHTFIVFFKKGKDMVVAAQNSVADCVFFHSLSKRNFYFLTIKGDVWENT